MKTILVIEDKQEVRENIAEMLQMARYHVVQAIDGRQACVRLQVRILERY